MHCEHTQEVLSAAHPSQRALSRRTVGLAVAGPCLLMIATAAMLHPRQSGYGTHEQLGLAPCYSLKLGWPCPHCGMTTSVSAAAHGQMSLAFRAQPFGIVLAAMAALLGLLGATQAMTGQEMLGHLRPRLWWLLAALAGTLMGWGWNLYCGITSGALPLR